MTMILLENHYSLSLLDAQNIINECKEYYKRKGINTTVIIYETNSNGFNWFIEIYGDRKV